MRSSPRSSLQSGAATLLNWMPAETDSTLCGDVVAPLRRGSTEPEDEGDVSQFLASLSPTSPWADGASSNRHVVHKPITRKENAGDGIPTQ